MTKSFEKQVKKAVAKREKLLAREELSAKDRYGELAIFYSAATLNDDFVNSSLKLLGPRASKQKVKRDLAEEIDGFLDVANRLEGERKAKHAHSSVTKASQFAIAEALRDRSVSSIVLIGHGSLNGMLIDHAGETNNFDWWQVSALTTHLKQGYFEQRSCSKPSRTSGNVPMGTFAVSKLSKIFMSIEENLKSADAPDSHFRSLYSDQIDLRFQISEMNANDPELVGGLVVAKPRVRFM